MILKNNKIMMGLLILVLLPIILAAVCPADNEPDISEIPCEEITPIIYNKTECNVTISNIYNPAINYTFVMTNRSDYTWNYSFDVNYSTSNTTSYTQRLCDNSTSNVTISPTETANEYWYIYFLFFGVFAIIFIIGEWKENFVFKYLAGSFLLVVGIYVFINGFPGQVLSYLGSGNSSAWISWTSFILIFLGLIYCLRTAYQNVWGGEE